MSTSFSVYIILKKISRRQIERLISNLSLLGFTLKKVKTRPRKEPTPYQEDKFINTDECIQVVLQQFQTSLLHDHKFSTIIYAWFQDILFWIHLITDDEKQVIFSPMNYWLRDFRNAVESYIPDTNRYIRLSLDVMEPFVMREFILSDGYPYLDEQIPENSLAVVIKGGDKFAITILDNILFNKFLISLKSEPTALPSINELERYMLNAQDPRTFYILDMQKLAIAKVVIYRQKTRLFLFPIAPYKMKMFNDERGVDLQFYLRLLLNICNHYPIWELRTNFC